MSSKLNFHSLNYFEAGLRPGIISSVNISVVALKDKNSLQKHAALVFTCKCTHGHMHTSNNAPCLVWSAVSLHPSKGGNASNFHEMKLWSYLMLKMVFLDTAKLLLKKYFLTVKNESLQSCSPFILSFLLKWGLLFCDFWLINGKSLERRSWVLWPLYHTRTWHGFPHTAAGTLLLMFLFHLLLFHSYIIY